MWPPVPMSTSKGWHLADVYLLAPSFKFSEFWKFPDPGRKPHSSLCRGLVGGSFHSIVAAYLWNLVCLCLADGHWQASLL